jgi:hypothetical protein
MPRRWVALLVVGCLVTSAPAAPGQTANPLGSAIRRAARDASQLDAARPQPPGGGDAQPSDWTDVQGLRSGTEVAIVLDRPVAGTRKIVRIVVAADETGLTVLNLENSTLPEDARRVLRNTAVNHPDYFAVAHAGQELAFEKHVQLGPDGVSMNGQRLARFDQLIERIPRADVRQIVNREARRNVFGCAAAGYGGFAAGALVGGLAGGAIGDAVSHTDAGGMSGMAIGLAAGGTAGATWLFRKCRAKHDVLVFAR